MLNPVKIANSWRGVVIAALAGASITLSLAPYSFWLFAIMSPAIFNVLLRFSHSLTRAFISSLAFGLGLYGSGASWVYISIHDFGFTSMPLAIVMTGLFVGFLGLVFSVPFLFYARFVKKSWVGFVFGFAAVWVLGEWLKTWLFTGFPWLFVGYAHIDTTVSGWSPIGGVFFLSFISVLTGSTLFAVCGAVFSKATQGTTGKGVVAPMAVGVFCVGLFWSGGLAVQNIEWTVKSDRSQSVAILQPNIPLEKKWNPYFYPEIMQVLEESALLHWDKDIQVWPEAALPALYSEAYEFYEGIDKQATQTDTHVYAGVLFDETDAAITQEMGFTVYNTMVGLGMASGVYHKQRLVPFGEYVPFEKQLRGLIAFFDLPTSVIRVGPYLPEGLAGTFNDQNKVKVAPFICYEIVYPDLVAKHAEDAGLLLTVSNDAWFGDSIGPLQHFQMARMRALENQKYLIRATNTGISAVIDAKANVIAQTKQFEQTTLTGDIFTYSGSTPFSRFHSLPILVLCGLIVLVSILVQRKRGFLD